VVNRQTGGTDASFVADAEDSLLYTTLRIDVLRKLQQCRAKHDSGQISPPPAAPSDLSHSIKRAESETLGKDMYPLITKWAKTVHQFGAGNPALTLYGDFPWKPGCAYEDLIALQANPTIAGEEVAFVVIGKDVTITDIRDGSLFLKGK
jgi:hypothetical protein